jgi:hydrogenase-4 component F
MNFDPVTLLLAIPTVAALLIALMPGSRASATLNTGASSLTFLAALSLLFVERPAPGAYLLVDEFSTIFLVLINFVSFTTSVFSATYVAHEVETGRVTPGFLRLYHALYQALTLAFNLALLSNNIGIMWVAIELATLTTVVMVGIYRTHAAIEAAWKYFILASVGIALALFGTILVYMAAEPVLGAGLNAMIWTDLVSHAASLEPAMLNLAFVFLLLGYGTKIGLFPLHAWLPDAHAEGPTPITAVLSGLLLNVALYALLRCKMLMAGNPGALAPGPLMILMGLVSLLFGAFMLYRRRDIKRLFAYSSIEHMGLITFAFGLGGPLANFAGLLHMVLHSLTKSAIFFSVGDISQVKGTQKIAEMGGLTKTNPLIGWGLVIGVAAIAGLPPLGIFTSEFLTVSATLAAKPWLALPLVLGLLIAVGALFLQLNRIAFGEPKGANHKVKCSYIPMFVHLALVLAACIYLPATLVAWFQAVARLLG